MRMLLFYLLVGMGLVAYQAAAHHVDGTGTTWRAADLMHDAAHHGGANHEGSGHADADCEHTVACGFQATCSPAVMTPHQELSLQHSAITCRSRLAIDYDSRTSPPASPPPRV
jgi:hypothetical protein